MLQKIIRFSVRNKLIVGIGTLALLAWGIFEALRLPIDAVPDITNNQVQVITQSPALAAPEVERLITFPIEQASSNIPGIVEMRSFSRFGLSLLTIVFDDATDIYWARQQVSERLQQVRTQIPDNAGMPELAPMTTGLGEIYQYVLRPAPGYEDRYGPMELRTLQDWIVRRQLLGTPGVADVSSFGGYLKQYEVAVDPARLASLHVDIRDVFDALARNNENTGGAYIERGPGVLFIRSEGLAGSLDEIGRIPVRRLPNGTPVLLRDLAQVRIGHANRYGAMTYNDQGEVAGAVVMMLKGGNSGQVVAAVKERIERIRKNLPEGVLLEPFLDRSKMVNHAIGTVQRNLLEGALIVVFILVLFLGNFRAGLIVASVIPLSLLFAIILMNLFGVSGNLMSLGALDFGLIVDGAVIIVEAVLHRLYYHKQGAAAQRISSAQLNASVEESAGRMMGSAVFGQAIILIVYLPILALVGIEGKMFRPMAQTVSFALIGAFLLSLTYVPMITSLALSRNIRHKATLSDRLMERLQKRYTPLLTRALRYPKTIILSVLLLFATAVVILQRLGGEFIPRLEEGDFAVDTRLLLGSSLTQTTESVQRSARLLKERFPEVEKVVTKIGSGEIPTDPMSLEAADMMVILKDKKEWTSAHSFDELANKMSNVLREMPGVTAGFQFPVQMRFNELMTGARQDVVCKIFGEDLDTLSALAHRLGNLAESVPGARDLYVENITGMPQVCVRYQRSALALYGVSVADVNRILRSAFAGEPAGAIYENERRFDLVVRMAQGLRTDTSDIGGLLVATPSGLQVPLRQLATVEIQDGPNQIQREDAKRRIVVGFNVRGRDVQSIVAELQSKVARELPLPPGYFVQYGGQFQNLVQARARLSVALPVALMLILLLLYFAFGSLRYGLLIFSAIPLSAIGGVYALWLRGMPFSISAGVGFIALFGVAVLNGIVLLSEFNRGRQNGYSTRKAVLQGTQVRLRPVLMTAAVASLGFLPMALSNGAGAEVQRPLATVVIGGLLSATLLTLLVLPVLYVWTERSSVRRRRKNTGLKAALAALMLGFVLPANAQPVVKAPLDSLLTRARNNRHLEALRLESTYWKQMQAAVYELPRTNATVEYGSINSAVTDTRFQVSQSFPLPIVYRRQSNWYAAQENLSRHRAGQEEQELLRAVRHAYFNLADLRGRERLLGLLDSLYRNRSAAAARRLQAGEGNRVEAVSAESRAQLLSLQLAELAYDRRVEQKKLQELLGSDTLWLPQDSVLLFTDTAASAAPPPLLSLLAAQEQLARATTVLEKNRLLPEWSIGYSNQSIRGWQSNLSGDPKFYGGGERFHTIQAGVSIPLFNRAARNRVVAARQLEQGARLESEQGALRWEMQREQCRERVARSVAALGWYRQQGLRQADELLQSARLGLEKGNLDYLQWSHLAQQALELQVGWLDALKQYNNAAIELAFYQNL